MVSNNFHGLCTFPNSGSVSFALMGSLMAAVATSTFAVTSCRFVALSYTSNLGSFEEYFTDYHDPNTPTVRHTVGVGLFTWLRPYDVVVDWSEGACAGYKRSEMVQMTDTMFEVSRCIAILVVIIGFASFIWSLFLTCATFNKIQKYGFIAAIVINIILTPLTFVFTRKSGLCTSIGNYPICELDQGSLIAICGVILYILVLLITVFWLDTDIDLLAPSQKGQVRKSNGQRRARSSSRSRSGRSSSRRPRSKSQKRSKEERPRFKFDLEC